MALVKITAFKIDLSIVLRSSLKAIIWLIVTTAYGTAPLLLLFFINSFSPDMEEVTRIKSQLKDMTILFLSSAMIAEVAVEALLCKIRFSKYAYFVFFVSSAMVLGLACIAYTVVVKTKPDKGFNFPYLWIFHTFVVTYTVLFCLSIKTIMFMEEDKIYKSCQLPHLTSL